MRPGPDAINALIWRELAAIGAIESAIPRQPDPGYTFLFTETKLEKQANITQMVTLLRINGSQPDFSTGAAGVALKAQTALTQAIDTTATLRAMRLVGRELVHQYTQGLEQAEGVASRTLRKALGRTIVQDTVLSAHIARRSGNSGDRRDLPRPLAAYFATPRARVCMRCLLDRPGRSAPLLRDEPRPRQYICAACHDEVFDDFPRDLREQATRWPEAVREDRVIHRALSRPARLQALHQVLHPLSGLAPEVPESAAERAVDMPTAERMPGPAPDTPIPNTRIDALDDNRAEDRYIRTLLDPSQVRAHW